MSLIFRRHLIVLVVLFVSLLLIAPLSYSELASADSASPWILPETPHNLYWGHRDGIVFSIWPGSLRVSKSKRNKGGPRGLIRIGYYDASEKRSIMLNFIAIEPIVNGKRGYSELEISQLDQVRGKRLWPVHPMLAADLKPQEPHPSKEATRLFRHPDGYEVMEVGIGVEPFLNGAHPYLVLSIDSRRPHEIIMKTYHMPDSADMKLCILTATMGNLIRARHLWLAGEVVESSKLFKNYKGFQFAGDQYFVRDKLLEKDGWLWAAITSDEEDPASVWPFAPKQGWHYDGAPVTQYWRVPNDHQEERCAAKVNGRAVYWMSRKHIPGGVAYENFDINRPYHPGGKFIFGITQTRPEKLGFKQSEK
jgi:hypothetical protein